MKYDLLLNIPLLLFRHLLYHQRSVLLPTVAGVLSPLPPRGQQPTRGLRDTTTTTHGRGAGPHVPHEPGASGPARGLRARYARSPNAATTVYNGLPASLRRPSTNRCPSILCEKLIHYVNLRGMRSSNFQNLLIKTVDRYRSL